MSNINIDLENDINVKISNHNEPINISFSKNVITLKIFDINSKIYEACDEIKNKIEKVSNFKISEIATTFDDIIDMDKLFSFDVKHSHKNTFLLISDNFKLGIYYHFIFSPNCKIESIDFNNDEKINKKINIYLKKRGD